jgi:hypothetical protein
MFMVDVGLLAAKGDLAPRTLLEGNKIFQEFKGALTEQFIAQELINRGRKLFYYSTDHSSGEIDFMVQAADNVIPVEVKAEENLKAQSLRAYCQKYGPDIAIRTSMSNYRQEEWMVNVPLYLLAEYICKLDCE